MAATRICSVENCGKPHQGRGYCNMHYGRFFRNGHTELLPRPTALQQKLRRLWDSINARCNSPKHRSWVRYGQKGIENRVTVEDLEFAWHRDQADLLAQPSIDRRNPDGHYEPGNIRFIELIENQKEGGRRGRGRPKLTREQVLEIVSLLDSLSQSEIGARFGVTQSNIACIARGKSWSHVTGRHLLAKPKQEKAA